MTPPKSNDNFIPLPSLFAKPRQDQLRISPRGQYLAWRGRSSTESQSDSTQISESKGDNHGGVLNIFIQKRHCVGPNTQKNANNDAKQITFYKDRDACVYFIFTPDEKTILYLRETTRGSEHYHLHAIDVDPFFQQDGGRDALTPLPALQPRDLIHDPNMTCAMGFCGGIQLWTQPVGKSTTSPVTSSRYVYVSTAQRGPFAMFWDISRIDIDSGECILIEQNIMSTWKGRVYFLLGTFFSWLANWICRLGSTLSFLESIGSKIKMDPPGIPIQWFPDDEMEFRGRLEVNLINLGGSFCVRERTKSKNRAWKTIHALTFEETNLQLIGSTGGSGTARMEFSSSSYPQDTVDMHLCTVKYENTVSDTTTYERFDVKNGKHLCRLACNPKSDISGFVVHPKTGRTQCVIYEWEKPTMEILVPKEEDDIDSHSQFVDDISFVKLYFEPSMSFRILSRTWNDDAWVIFAESDVGQECCRGSPGGYFLFTRSACSSQMDVGDLSMYASSDGRGREIQLVFPSRPELSQYQLAKMEPVHIPARDGEDILCYLSSPHSFNSFSHADPPPLIMVIHGGPQARDSWGYNPLCQLLCNRGFRTLQVNYRGSTGFGHRFLQIGMNGQFYQSLQTDIIDAAKYATRSSNATSSKQHTDLPWGDPDKLAILGASFGGYSALWGMAFSPGLYKCAVAIVPVAAVGAANEQSKTAFGGSPLVAKYWHQVFGEKVTSNVEIAKEASPMYHMDKVCDGSSIAMFHGENDPRAPVEHSYRVVEGLKISNESQVQSNVGGVSGEFVTFADEGHGIAKEANVLFMYDRIEKFLCRRLCVDNARGTKANGDSNDSTIILEEKWTRGHTATIHWSKDSGELEVGVDSRVFNNDSALSKKNK